MNTPIKSIYSLSYRFAKEHVALRAFTFGLPSKVEGTGEKPYPLFCFEFPALAEYSEYGYDVKFDCVIVDNDQRKQEVTRLEECEVVADEFRAFLDNEDWLSVTSFSTTQLSHFSDDDATGVRISVGLRLDGVNICIDETMYDPAKEIERASSLPTIQGVVGDRDLPIISFESEPEYLFIEYAESKGGCYIDLGVKPSKDLDYSIRFAITDTSIQEQSVMGASESGKRTLIGMNYGYLWHQCGEADWMQKTADIYPHDATTDPAVGHFFLDSDNRGIPQGDTYADLNFYLFAENFGGVASNFSNARVYSVQIGSMNLQPALRMTDRKVVFVDDNSKRVFEPTAGELYPPTIR